MSSDHHMIHRAKTVSQFLSKIYEKKFQSSFNPFAKERRDLNFWRNGVILQGEFADDAQSAPAFPKRRNHAKKFALGAKIHRIFLLKIFFCRRKMKCRESSETCFGKV